jgi:DNA mismatch repair protein MutS
VSIAWAVAEHIHDRVGAKTLFATHYHELGALAAQHARVRNVSVAAREWKGEVVFLRKLTAGGASRSFGVEVAEAGRPAAAVVERGRAILRTLESEQGRARRICRGRSRPPTRSRPRNSACSAGHDGHPADPMLPVLTELAATLRATDPDELSPRAAHDLLTALVKKLTHPS